jgi:hypothetical protein
LAYSSEGDYENELLLLLRDDGLKANALRLHDKKMRIAQMNHLIKRNWICESFREMKTPFIALAQSLPPVFASRLTNPLEK